MIQVAVIDNGIGIEYKTYIKQSLKVTHSGVLKDNKYSCSNMHAGTCAYILKKYYNDCEITNLDIFDMDEKADINMLKQALQWCLDNKINVVSLSAGSCWIEDIKVIQPIINELIKNNTYIVAAANNYNSITFPASLEGVIGVKCDLSDILSEGEIIVDKKDIRKVEVTVGTLKDNDELLKYDLGHNNSFVVPYIAAKVCYAIEQGIEVWEFLNSHNKKNLNTDFYLRSFPLMYNPEPIVIELNPSGNSLLKQCIESFAERGYYAIGIVEKNVGIDNCYVQPDFFWINESKAYEYIIKSLNPDVVFVLENYLQAELKRDCIIKINENAKKYQSEITRELDNEDFSDDHMKYIGNYGNYGICVSDAMETIKPENFYFEGDIDEETKKRILEAIASGEVLNESDERDIEMIEIREEQISMLVNIVEEIFG